VPPPLASDAERAKALALEAGFDRAGIASADAPAELAHFADWIAAGAAGTMTYLTDQADRRASLKTAFPWARSILCVALQYDTPAPYSTEAARDSGWIARYAWGDDYHDVMKVMLERLRERLRTELGPMETRVYADTGPIVERAYAAAAGLGAWGKNTCLLDPVLGSWFFLGEIVVDREWSADGPRADMCGTCTACLDACPTGAFPRPYFLDATRCISYLTIEQKGAIPEDLREGIGRHVFGCDICQDVCPWNRKRKQHGPAAFTARPGLVAPDLGGLASLDDEGFRERFRKSPIKRAKRRGLLRNVAVAMANSGDTGHRPALERLAQDDDMLVREHAFWALRVLERTSCPDVPPGG
jgi:epoxyqueuosine reductase